MSKKRKETAARGPEPAENLRLSPEKRLCPRFDSAGIAKFEVASREEMGWRVVDDCTEEHIM